MFQSRNPIEHLRLGRINRPLHAVAAALQVTGHCGVAGAGVGRGQFRVHVVLPDAPERYEK